MVSKGLCEVRFYFRKTEWLIRNEKKLGEECVDVCHIDAVSASETACNFVQTIAHINSFLQYFILLGLNFEN